MKVMYPYANPLGAFKDGEQQSLSSILAGLQEQQQQQQQQGGMFSLMSSLNNPLLLQSALQSPYLRGQPALGQVAPSNTDVVRKDERMKQRLARNRTTARLRRERKKQEAESLTKLVSALRLRVKELEASFNALEEPAKSKARRVIDSHGEPPLACQFCTLTFDDKGPLDDHVRLNHSGELKAREQFFKDSKSFGVPATATDAQGTAPTGSANIEEEPLEVSRMSSEERKRRRLERNAASARLCRQRKKLYIESLRSQLPGMRHKVKAFEAALPADVVQQIAASAPIPEFNFAELSSPGPEEEDDKMADRRASMASIGSMEELVTGKRRAASMDSTSPIAKKLKKVDDAEVQLKVEGQRVPVSPDHATAAATTPTTVKSEPTPPRAQAADPINVPRNDTLPPLSGWSKVQRQRGRERSESVSSSSAALPPSVTNPARSSSSPLSSMATFENAAALLSQGLLQPGLSPLLQSVFPRDLVLPPRGFQLGQTMTTKPKGQTDPELMSAALALANFTPPSSTPQ